MEKDIELNPFNVFNIAVISGMYLQMIDKILRII